MTFNLFRKSPSFAAPPPSPSTYKPTSRPTIQHIYLPLDSPMHHDHAFKQGDLLIGDGDQTSGWEVPEECCWLETIHTRSSARRPMAADGHGKCERKRKETRGVNGSSFVEMMDVDVDEEESIVVEGQREAVRRGSCLFDADEEVVNIMEMRMEEKRPPMSPGRRASSFFVRLTGKSGREEQGKC